MVVYGRIYVKAVLKPKLVVVLSVARSNMYAPRAGFERNVVCGKYDGRSIYKRVAGLEAG